MDQVTFRKEWTFINVWIVFKIIGFISARVSDEVLFLGRISSSYEAASNINFNP